MAFLNRVRNVLKQTISKHVNSELSPSNPSLFQAIRSMSSSKLFVGGLSYNTDEMSLREAFSQYGEVVEARVILDRDTGRSRGFGFVTFTSTEAASSAIQAFDGQDLHGRRVRVNYATERPRGGGFGGGGFGSGGGYAYGYGGQGGNYGRGGYQGGGFGGDSNFSGGGGYGGGNQYSNEGGYGVTNNYNSGGGGFGSGSQYSDGGSGFGAATTNYPSGGSGYAGKYGSSDGIQTDSTNDSGNQAGFSSILNETSGANSEIQDPVGSDQGAIADTYEVDDIDGNDKDDSEEPDNYANTRN